MHETVDGYDPVLLSVCLAERGVLVPADAIVGVSQNGYRVDLRSGGRVTVLPSWIEEAADACRSSSRHCGAYDPHTGEEARA